MGVSARRRRAWRCCDGLRTTGQRSTRDDTEKERRPNSPAEANRSNAWRAASPAWWLVQFPLPSDSGGKVGLLSDGVAGPSRVE